MQYCLKNEYITIKIDDFGAELTSIFDTQLGTEYLWNADSNYWKRHSPILFPFVGSLNNKSYQYQGQTYPSLQHGFARDMSFHLLEQSENEIQFYLEATEDTLKIYPFHFYLELGYRLEGRKITVTWSVVNKDQKTMFFSIGGHPAFQCPLCSEEAHLEEPASRFPCQQSEYFISFDSNQSIHYQNINENGLLVKQSPDQQSILPTNHGLMQIDPHIFDKDALIIEDHQCHKVSLLTPDKVPYLTVTFDAPLFGLWSPAKKNAPFICIEPWYGRCDAENFNGTLEERDYGNTLPAGQTFNTSYTIEI